MSASGLAAIAKVLARVEDHLAALLAAYSPDPKTPIGVAVSGGSDSLALLHVAASAHRHVHVFTVDHRLRPESADEARWVAEQANALGLPHKTLSWKMPRPGQAAARDARYRLLAEAVRTVGARVLLLGHTFDDVLETVLIRKRHKAPLDQLAGPMPAAPCPVWPEGRGMTLLRPLLQLRRETLRDSLRTKNVAWIEDPSNDAVAYERVRVRHFLRRHPALCGVMREIAEGLMAKREVRDRALGGVLADPQRVEVRATGLIAVNLEGLEAPLAARVMAVLLRIAGGHDRPPSPEPVAELLSRLQDPGSRRTLAGAWVQKAESGFLIGRDPGEVKAQIKNDIFDGRYARDAEAALPDELPILIREARPPGPHWRSLIAERIALEARAYQTLRVSPVQI